MIRLILHIMLLIALAVFVSLNVPYRTTINLFGAVAQDVSVVVVVLLALVAGVLYSFLTYVMSYLARRRAHLQKEQAVRTREKEKELQEREKGISQLLREEATAAPKEAGPPVEVKRKSRPSLFKGR